MNPIVRLLALLILTLPVPSVAGHVPPGEPRFGVNLIAVSPSQLGQEFTLIVRAGSARHGSGCTGDVTVSIPEGLTVIRGETSRRVRFGAGSPSDLEWQITVRPERLGQFSARAVIHISCGSQPAWDEAETRIDFDVQRDTILVHGGYATRHERMQDGKLFRYGGSRIVRMEGTDLMVVQPGHMVRIANSESLAPEDIVQHPKLLTLPIARCTNCAALKQGIRIRCVVTVSRDGAVTWIEGPENGAEKIDPNILTAVENALRSARFQPAQAKGGPVDDWGEVDVMVQP